MKKILVTAFIMTLLSFSNIQAEEIHKEEVEQDKVWTVTFNTPLNQETVNTDTVFVRNEKGEKVEGILLEYQKDNRELKVMNQALYQADQTYKLFITDQVKSLGGYTLNEPVVVSFSVNETNLKIENLSPGLTDYINQLEKKVATQVQKIKELKEQLEELEGNQGSSSSTQWIEKETEHVKFKMTEQVFKHFPHIYKSAEPTLTYLEDFFGEELSPKQTVILHAGEVGIEYDDVAIYKGGKNKMIINVQHFFSRGNRDARYHLAHELVHGFEFTQWDMQAVRETLGSDKKWLREGLAEYLPKHKVEFSACSGCGEMKEQFYDKERFATKLRTENISNTDPYDYSKIKDLSDTLDTERTMGGYLVYESVIFYMIEHFGKESFNRFIESIEERKGLNESLEQSFGLNEEDFVEAWKEYFQLDS